MSRGGRYFHGHATGPVELERSWRARPESELPLVVPICSHRRQAAPGAVANRLWNENLL